MNFRLLIGLALCNTIWAANPIFGKYLLGHFTPLQTGWLRYGFSFVALVVFTVVTKNFPVVMPAWNRRTYGWLILVMLTTFCLSPFMQYAGLIRSTASVNSLLVIIEPLACVVLAWLILGERMRHKQWAALVISVAGFLLLSRVGIGTFDRSVLLGSFFLLISMPCEATYTVVSRVLRGKVEPLALQTITMGGGMFVFTLIVAAVDGLPDLTQLDWQTFAVLLWLGPFATTLGYLYWTYALVEAPVAPVALTLLIQPLVGSLGGVFLLKEHLSLLQILGGLLILAALLLQTDFKGKKNEKL